METLTLRDLKVSSPGGWLYLLTVSLLDIRHTCEHGDGLKSYGWVKHDGRTFGNQKIADPAINITFTTEFIKGSGIDHGWCIEFGFNSLLVHIGFFFEQNTGTWALRVSGRGKSRVMLI